MKIPRNAQNAVTTSHHFSSVILEGFARGEAAIRDGRIYTHKQAKKKLRRWLKSPE